MSTQGQSQCPKIEAQSHLTQNGLGKSSYNDLFMGYYFANLYFKGKLNLNKPVLMVGAGYGAGVVELMALGANLIYLNDLSSENLACAKMFINKTLPLKKNFIQYIPGDITHSDVIEKIPDHSLSIVYAKNIIPFLDAKQLLQLIKKSHDKLDSNGLLLFVFENNRLEEQIDMVRQINARFQIASKKDLQVTLDDIVIQQYREDKICSFVAYENTPKSLRTNGFPCILYGDNFLINFLMPSTIELLLKQNGFIILDSTKIAQRDDTFIITAKKN